MQTNNHVQSQRPMLVILAHFTDTAMAHDQSWYDDMVFNPAHQPRSVNGYYQTISNGRFSWTRGGTVWIDVPPSQRYSQFLSSFGAAADTLYASNLVYWAMLAFPSFCNYATNGQVGPEQLTILIIKNDGGGASRPTGNVQPPGSTCTWNGTVAEQDHQGEFLTMCHELCHQLGAIDLYGSSVRDPKLNIGLTLMDPTITFVLDDPTTYLLDPWHKLQLGWCQPRIASLHSGGVTDIPAAQMGDPTAPFILYDPLRGPQEYWLLEYRSATSPSGNVYDTNVPGNGLVIWHVQQNSDKSPMWLADAQFPANTETNWWYCQKCEGMHFLGSPASPGPCPAGGSHQPMSGVNGYRLLMNNSSVSAEHGWRWCDKCLGLFYGPNQASSRCPADGGTHDGSHSADYSLFTNQPRPYDSGWRRCLNCQGLFHPQGSDNGHCPFGAAHSPGATPYSPPHQMDYVAVAAEAAPDLLYGGSAVWGSDTNTPPLLHYDGNPTSTSLHVRPFTSGTGDILVEWLTVEDIWVDFAYSGIENGTFDAPFNTLAEGVAAVPYAGALAVNTLHIKTGSRAETARITKPMHVQAYGGRATIGR